MNHDTALKVLRYRLLEQRAEAHHQAGIETRNPHRAMRAARLLDALAGRSYAILEDEIATYSDR